MKRIKNILTLFTLCIGSSVITIPVSGQVFPREIKRIDLQRYDLSIPGKEFIQARIDIPPGIQAPRHKHPGEEIIYVLKGEFEYQLDGSRPVRLKAGDVLFIPAGTYHTAKNIGTGMASELATYVVTKGKPLLILANKL